MEKTLKTERIDLLQGDYEKGVQRAAQILREGGIVAIPTETVYGLAADATNDAAIAKVFAAKGRPQDNPLIVHIAGFETLYEISADLPQSAVSCAEKFWPGPFTMVVKSSGKVANSVSAGLQTVAVRMPLDNAARDIIAASGRPLAAPSANISGSPSPTSARHVINDLDGLIDAVVISQDCAVGVESTVVSFAGDLPRLLRPGAVTLEQLREIIPDIAVDTAVLSEPEKGAKAASPGMKYKHYAPKTETFLIEGDSKDFTELVNQKPDCLAVCFDEESEKIRIRKICYGSANDGKTLANKLFSVLRQVDEIPAKAVYIHAPSKNGIGLAVYNRLIRAAGFKVIVL